MSNITNGAMVKFYYFITTKDFESFDGSLDGVVSFIEETKSIVVKGVKYNGDEDGIKKLITDLTLKHDEDVSSLKSDLIKLISGKAPAVHKHKWADISDAPTEMKPSTHNHAPTEITQNSSNRFVTDTEKTKWNLTDTIVRGIKMKDSTEPLITAKNEIIIPTIAGPKGENRCHRC